MNYAITETKPKEFGFCERFFNERLTLNREITSVEYIPPAIRNVAAYLHVWNNVYYKDKDGLIQVIGQRGECKSGFGLRFAYDFDVEREYIPENKTWQFTQRFSMNKVCFLAPEIVKFYKDGFPKGTVIIWDEVGVDYSSSDSYFSTKAKMLKWLLETNRYMNGVLIMTAPSLKSVNVGARRLINCLFHAKGKIFDGNWAEGYFSIFNTNAFTGEQYPSAPYYTKEGIGFKNNIIHYQRMPLVIEKEYKNKKDAYSKNWYNYIDSEMSFMKEYLKDEGSEKKTIDSVKKEILSEPNKFLSKKGGRFSGQLIHYYTGLALSRANILAKGLNSEFDSGAYVFHEELGEE